MSVTIDLDAASTDATVSVAELKVPSKASKALEKARHAVSRNKLEDADRYITKGASCMASLLPSTHPKGDIGTHQEVFRTGSCRR